MRQSELEYNLKRSSRLTNVTSSDFLVSGAPIQTGQLPPALLGFAPNFTTEVGSTSYFFHKSFMTIAAQKGITVQVYDLGVEGKRATRVNVDKEECEVSLAA